MNEATVGEADKEQRIDEIFRYIAYTQNLSEEKGWNGVIHYDFTGFESKPNGKITRTFISAPEEGSQLLMKAAGKADASCTMDVDCFLDMYAGENYTSVNAFADAVYQGKLWVGGPWGATLSAIRFGNSINWNKWEEFYEWEQNETERWENETESQTQNLLYKITTDSNQHDLQTPNHSIHSFDDDALDFLETSSEVAVKQIHPSEPLKITVPSPFGSIGTLWRAWKKQEKFFQTPFTKPELYAGTYSYHKKLTNCSLKERTYLRPKDLMKRLGRNALGKIESWSRGTENGRHTFEEYNIFQ